MLTPDALYVVLRLDDADADEWRQGIGEELDLEGNYAVLVDVLLRWPLQCERLRAELRLARAVIHELAWGPDTITDRPRLRDALKAWGEADKADLLPEGEQP
jgi:hypothetical protein